MNSTPTFVLVYKEYTTCRLNTLTSVAFRNDRLNPVSGSDYLSSVPTQPCLKIDIFTKMKSNIMKLFVTSLSALCL